MVHATFGLAGRVKKKSDKYYEEDVRKWTSWSPKSRLHLEVNEGSMRRFLATLDRAERGRQTIVANLPSKETMDNITATASTDDGHGNFGITAPPIAPTPTPHHHPDLHKLVPANNKLAVFRQLTGIDSVPALKLTEILGRPASNLGIYARTVRAEDRATLQYRIFSFLINACLGIQIIVAASLTALGAGNGPHRVVTGFGAINTIIAGFLTYLKGSGLPNRYKHQQNQWEKVREYIEQRERDFCLERCTLEVDEEIDIIERMYEDVRSEMESSMPDSYGSSEARGRKGLPSVLASVGHAGLKKEEHPTIPTPTHVSKQKDVLV